MRNCNWMITDLNNKKRDIIYFYKTQHFNNIITLEEKIIKIASLRKCNGDELIDIHKGIPENFKHLADKNLGCA